MDGNEGSKSDDSSGYAQNISFETLFCLENSC